MSNEIQNQFAVELSDSELDTVAGGFSLVIGNGQSLTNDSVSKFSQKDLLVSGGTFAGPGGAGNTFGVAAREIYSFSNQNLGVGN
ncbi:hypothetical protein NIES4101_52720 [Calothrix sp. NIES-4101]|nr:hypothetical protein NIES4101_52720 [Calothrix sp. NIES-4101]